MGTFVSKCCDDCFCVGRKATVNGVINDIKELTREEYDHLYEEIVHDKMVFGLKCCG